MVSVLALTYKHVCMLITLKLKAVYNSLKDKFYSLNGKKLGLGKRYGTHLLLCKKGLLYSS